MKYDLVSDLHVDIQGMDWHKALVRPDWAAVRNPDSRVLVVAGDTTNRVKKTITALQAPAAAYEWVVFVDGNHEHYDSKEERRTVRDGMAYLLEQSRKTPNLIYLNGETELLLDGTLFIGACGWYDFRFGEPEFSHEAQREVWAAESSDPRWIYWGWGGVREYAADHAKALAAKVAEAQDRDDVREIVVITHTIPHRRGITYRPGDRIWNALNGAYGNFGMAEVVAADRKRKIVTWNFGHTHIPHDFVEGGIRYVCAPRGYHNRNDLRQMWTQPVQIDTAAPQSAFGPIE